MTFKKKEPEVAEKTVDIQAPAEAKKPEKVKHTPIRVKALQTCYYDDGLRMPGSIFVIKGEHDFNPRAMKKVDHSTPLSNTPVMESLNNKRIPPGPVRSREEQELENERLEAERSSGESVI
jgi:hypothetical protein